MKTNDLDEDIVQRIMSRWDYVERMQSLSEDQYTGGDLEEGDTIACAIPIGTQEEAEEIRDCFDGLESHILMEVSDVNKAVVFNNIPDYQDILNTYHIVMKTTLPLELHAFLDPPFGRTILLQVIFEVDEDNFDFIKKVISGGEDMPFDVHVVMDGGAEDPSSPMCREKTEYDSMIYR